MAPKRKRSLSNGSFSKKSFLRMEGERGTGDPNPKRKDTIQSKAMDKKG